MPSLLKLIIDGSNVKKLVWRRLFPDGFELIMTWLEYFGQNLSGASSPKMAGYNHTVCVGVKPESSGIDVTRLQPITVKWSSHKSRLRQTCQRVCWLDRLPSKLVIPTWRHLYQRILPSPCHQGQYDLETDVKGIKSTRLLFIENCHFVAATGTKTTLTGQFQPSLGTLNSSARRKSTHSCARYQFTDITNLSLSTTWMRTLFPFKLNQFKPWKSWMNSKRKTLNRNWTLVVLIFLTTMCRTEIDHHRSYSCQSTKRKFWSAAVVLKSTYSRNQN